MHTQHVENHEEGNEARAHEEAQHAEGDKVYGKGGGDACHHDDQVGRNEGPVSAVMVRGPSEEDGATNGTHVEDGLGECRLPRIVTHPVKLQQMRRFV